MESLRTNRINALHKKQHYSFPPSLFSTPFIQPVHPAWNNATGREQPPEYVKPVFPKIPDEFWDKVGVKKAKGKSDRNRKGMAKAY